jgi:hypothetical protein
MVSYSYHSRSWSRTGCAGSYKERGWYTSKKDGDKFVASVPFRNPATGKKYTDAELVKLCPSCAVPK